MFFATLWGDIPSILLAEVGGPGRVYIPSILLAAVGGTCRVYIPSILLATLGALVGFTYLAYCLPHWGHLHGLHT